MDPHFTGVIFQTHAGELARRLTRPFPAVIVLDVRPRADWEAGHIPGAVSTSAEKLAGGLPEGVPAGAETIVVGADPFDPAVRSASLALRRLGVRRIVEFSGGMHEWEQARLHRQAAGQTAAAKAA